ncbi:ATP-binding protein [Marinomonas sp. C2222]|uniref:histidine kinase n=1 Tax=Marinomonas sargassi TaxID=2984494 RepID=A0ABT2YNC4_9GAMM|nr:ATP-binding protein [Marinomonas sargassi]MCV2401341.1 ATP-binding protein [Marinomonas sargassi]
MKDEIWRLFRHLVILGVVILLGSYTILHFVQDKLNVSKTEQLLCVDAQISSALLLSGAESQLPESHFNWYFHSTQPFVISEVASFFESGLLVRLDGVRYQYTIVSPEVPLLTGISSQADSHLKFESLLGLLLLSEKISYLDKIALIESMSCLSVSNTKATSSSPLTSITFQHDNHHEYGYIWQDESAEGALYLTLKHEEYIAFKTVILLVVIVIVVIMLLVIWRQFMLLEAKSKMFEKITLEIARGRGGLSKDISDSNGALKELAFSFDSMSSHIERLLKVQKEMIHAISHELRTPIARLRFGLEVMKDEVSDSVGTTINALEGDVEELNVLVDEVLTYGQLESDSLELHFNKVSIYSLINEIVQHNQLLLKHLTVEVKVEDVNELVVADQHHLSRAMQNLILNASKYAATKLVVTFSSDSERWQIDIEDDGPGIIFEDRDKVFIPFQRLDNSRTRASGGYGLGLAIVQRIAFWHGGAVLIGDSDIGGAKFSFIWSSSHHKETLA